MQEQSQVKVEEQRDDVWCDMMMIYISKRDFAGRESPTSKTHLINIFPLHTYKAFFS